MASEIDTSNDENSNAIGPQSVVVSTSSSSPPPTDETRNPKRTVGNPEIEKADKHWLDYTTAGFAFIAAFGSICAVVVGDWQWDAMNHQLGVMREQSRPWIKTTISFARPIRFSEWDHNRWIHVPLRFDLKNFGSAPATNARIVTIVSPYPGNAAKQTLDATQEAACKQARETADGDKIGGVAIFPGEPTSVETGGGTGGLYKTDQPIIFSITGCIDYTYADDRHGQTAFRKILGRVNNDRVVGIAFVKGESEPYQEPISPELLATGFPKDPPTVARVRTDDLYFHDDDGGNYAK